MIFSNVLILTAAVIFQHCAFLSEAADLGKHAMKQQEAPTPEDLLKQFEDLTVKLVDEAKTTIKATKENADAEVPGLEDYAKKQFDAKHLEFTSSLDVIKAESEVAGVDAKDCIEDATFPIDDSLKNNGLHATICVSNHTTTVNDYTEMGLKRLERFSRNVQVFQKKLEKCGTDANCRINVSVLVARAITLAPGQIEDDVRDIVKQISAETVKECISVPLKTFTDTGRLSIDIGFGCLRDKINQNQLHY